ncbi:hypothetical protein [Alkalihalobacillus sp. AL-G]|uniref:YkvI family membrane protein n=1 Tax=Alkalihalobacillus sp. AL-G TaxID=2926399 RepID=UPI00272D0027|nr:hypothetical protein [Alkalihalobacillus sp. AL-G]WLD93380.1 hypothetical protein MOJ78_20725 [Alkalihalobacillus sp. AL-G]
MIRAGFQWMFLILGTVIGAGYASGRELWQFFGHESVLAIGLFSLLFSFCCYVIMSMSFEEKSIHYRPVLERLIGSKLTVPFDLLIILYLFSTTVVMLAGGGATLHAFRVPYWIGVLIIVMLLVVLFFWDVEGMISMNAFVIPLLVMLLLFVLFLFMRDHIQQFPLDFQHQKNWPSAFTFTALNILPLVAVLSAVGNQIRNKGEILIASIGSGVILGGISILYNQSLISIANEIILYEIPLFAILKHYPYFWVLIMSVLLWIAIYTTAASGVFGIITRFRKHVHIPLWLMSMILLLFMVPLTTFGFSTLIAVLYPIYGILNLYVLAAILLQPFMNRSRDLQ